MDQPFRHLPLLVADNKGRLVQPAPNKERDEAQGGDACCPYADEPGQPPPQRRASIKAHAQCS